MSKRDIKTIDIKSFEFLFNAVDAIFPPILSSDLNYIVTLKKYFNIYRYRFSKVLTGKEQGLYIYSQKHIFSVTGGNLFGCKTGTYILQKFLCDGIKDCPGGEEEDEKNCQCEAASYVNRTTRPCKYMNVKMGKKACSSFYIMFQDGSCHIYQPPVDSTNISNDAINPFHKFTCKNGKQINKILINDLFSDCGPDADDEYHLNNIINFHHNYKCPFPEQLPCLAGHSKCYNISDICTYKLNVLNHLTRCRTGTHLLNCIYFECNIMFKCPGYHCIHWSYVCDGKWDCSQGYDELEKNICGPIKECISMYKCRDSVICIHLENTCDSTPDCLHSDDEMYCDLKHIICPAGCNCLLYTVKCWNIRVSNGMIQTLFTYAIVLIEHIVVQDVSFQGHGVPMVIRLSFTNSGIQYLCSIVSQLEESRYVNFSFNQIIKIESNCFSNAEKIQVIVLKHNKITNIYKFAFLHLIPLNILDLSYNKLCIILENSLTGPSDLQFLSIKYNNLLNMKINMIKVVNAKYIDTNNFYICCSIPNEIICNAKRPWYASCPKLMQKTHNWFSLIINFILLSPNVLSILLYLPCRRTLVQKHKIKAIHIIITSVNTVDLTFGLYLLIIWLADSFYKEQFVMKAFLWKSDRICFFAYALVLNFNLLSPVTLLFMAILRFFVVIHPLKSTFIRPSTVFLCVCMQYLMVGFATASLTVFKKVQSIVVSNTLCSPFIDPAKNDSITKIIICFTAVLQLLLAVSIFVIYLYIHKSICPKFFIKN